MLATTDDGGGAVRVLPPADPPPVLEPVDPPPIVAPTWSPSPVGAPAAGSTEARNAAGETLAQAEAAVLNEVADGALGAEALARHPLPPGTPADEALRLLASLPQTTYSFGEPGGTVTGPPVGSSDAVGDTGDSGRELESAYRPAGVTTQWRNLVDVFKTTVPRQHAAVDSAAKSLLEVFR